MANEDIILAQKVISLADSNLLFDKAFHTYSGIYLTSNEYCSGFQKFLNNREKIISVIASGDQILNCILGGTKKIDSFDISIFPKYFLRLKMAGVQALTKEEFIDFFFGNIRPDDYYDDLYRKMRIFLDQENREFWDSLFDFFDWYDMVHSTLFSSEPFVTNHVVEYNTYLQGDNYRLLKKMIKDVDVTTREGDILDIYSTFKGEYDLVYLSNIISYVDINRYKAMLDKFNLTDQGIILTYLYVRDGQLVRMFNSDKVRFESVEGATSSLMIQHR